MRNPLPLKTWLILAAVVIFCIALAGWCSARKEAGTAKDQATIADGRTASAVETLDVMARNADENSAEAAQLETIQNEIRNETDPVARDALARRRLCQLQGHSAC